MVLKNFGNGVDIMILKNLGYGGTVGTLMLRIWYPVFVMLQNLHYHGTNSLKYPKFFSALIPSVPSYSLLWYHLFNIFHNTEEFGIFLRISTKILKNL